MRCSVLLALTGCAVFDPSRPIELVPDPSWSAAEVATLTAAAGCWNLQFGMQLGVTTHPGGDQMVRVAYTDFVCLDAAGLFTPGVPARIDICPQHHEQDIPPGENQAPLFMTVVHELGHAAGIRVEGSEQFSVMGKNQQAYDVQILHNSLRAFSDEDRALIHDADPDFVPAPACPMVLMVVGDLSPVQCACP